MTKLRVVDWWMVLVFGLGLFAAVALVLVSLAGFGRDTP